MQYSYTESAQSIRNRLFFQLCRTQSEVVGKKKVWSEYQNRISTNIHSGKGTKREKNSRNTERLVMDKV